MDRPPCLGTIKHYYHIFAGTERLPARNWKQAVDEHMAAITETGLRDNCLIFIGIVGTPANREVVKAHLRDFWKLEYQLVAEADDGWEQVTMDQIDVSEPCKVFYAHTKGSCNVSAINNEWRRSMTAGCVGQWRRAVDLLDIVDLVGCYWRPDDYTFPRHFSGTFWWATSEYLAKLPKPVPNDNRWRAEQWIGMSRGQGPFKIYDLNKGGVSLWNLIHRRDLTAPPPGYEKFVCYGRTMGYSPGHTIHVAPSTPLLRAVLDKAVHLKRVAQVQSDYECVHTIY